MAKKAQAEETVEVAPQPVVKKTTTPKKPQWEVKDRQYYLRGDSNPLTYVLTSKSKPKILFC